MKKIILSAASLAVAAVASVSVAPTTSEAIPAFARQTGAACLNCHFQSFPTLAAFGRSFKLGGMTDVGDQALIEDEGLSIPAVVNWTVMVRPNFTSTDDGTGAAKVDEFQFADQVFMIGGRAAEHTGVFLEVGGGTFANAQMINSFDMGDNKAGVTISSTGFGEDAGMQVMSVWGQHGGMLEGKSLSINGAMAGSGSVNNGVALWAGNETWVAQLAFVNSVESVEADVQPNFKFSPVIRGNYFLEAGDWEIGLGAIVVSGSVDTADQKRTGIDAQAFGEVNDMQIGVFADWATAPAGSASAANVYNASTTDARTGYSFRASVKPTHNVIILAGIGQDKTGATQLDKTLVGVEYEMYQNGVINFVYHSDDQDGTVTKTTTVEMELLI